MRIFEKRKNPARPSRRSGIVSVLLLLLLPLIVGAVVWKGGIYDPSIYVYNVQGHAAVIPHDVLDGVPGVGLHPDGNGQTFTPKNLYEKIDGNQPAYTSFGFIELYVRSYTSHPGGDPTEIYVYDMSSAQNAFGIYSQEKPDKAEFLPLGTEGYRVGSSVLFAAGHYYVKISSVEAGKAAADRSLAAAYAILAKLPDAHGKSGGFAFPPEHLKPDSLQYIKANGLGLSFLTNTMIATYLFNGKETTAYYTKDGNSAKKYQSYLAYAREMGKVLKEEKVPGGRMAVLEIFNVKEMILAEPGVFCGLQSVGDTDQGRTLLLSLAERAAPRGGSK